MDRFKRFAHNAGTLGVVQTALVTAVLLYITARSATTGAWVATVPALAAAMIVSYLIRGFLVNNIASVRWVMNIIAVAVLVFFFIIEPRMADPQPVWLRGVFVGAISLYVGCYFWMLSDPKIMLVK